MKKTTTLLIALIAFWLHVDFVMAISTTTDKVYIDNFWMVKGEQQVVGLRLTNMTRYTAFQCDVFLPEGMTFAMNDQSSPTVSLGSANAQSHIIQASDIGNNGIRIVAMSMSNVAFSSENTVVNITVNAGANVVGQKTINIKNVRLVNVAQRTEFEAPATQATANIVEKRTVITAKDCTRKYGDANPAFEYTIEGPAIEGTPEITCSATTTSAVGAYDIVVKKGTIENTCVDFVAGKLTVEKTSLVIAAKDYTIKQGEALPAYEVTYSGFKNNETDEALTKKPTVTCAATSGSAVGAYDIIVSGAEAENYDITLTKGTLTIAEADPVTVTAKSYTREYGEANPTFEYSTEGKALEGIPEVSCEATASSPVGTYDIVVKKGTVTNYNDSYVNGKLTITKASLTVTAKNYVVKQGESLPTFDVTYSGFKNDETASVLTKNPKIVCTVNSTNVLGIYDITVSGAEAKNYDVNYVAGTLTVIDADAVVVTAKSYIREYGEANPAFEYEAVGKALEGTPEISCEATEASSVGTYDIVIKKGSVTNYNDSYVYGTLTITKAPLTITAKNYTIKQGDALPTFEVTYAGFKNNETEKTLTKKPTITCIATQGCAVGTYDIIVSGAEAKNYDISYVAGTLTVIDADAVAVTAKSYTRKYGEANPVFEYEVVGEALVGTPEIFCEATKASPAGTYDIVVKQGTVKNYNVTYVAGKLTITKAQLAVGVKDVTITEGDAIPAFTLTYSGFLNKDTDATALTEKPTATTTATSNSPAGTYDITVSGGSAKNYELSYTSGVLTILQKKVELPGDANNDGVVNVFDVTAMVNYILGSPSDNFVFDAADVNGDGIVNVFDVTKVVNIILGVDVGAKERDE